LLSFFELYGEGEVLEAEGKGVFLDEEFKVEAEGDELLV
jgi:hypothetical protein